MTAAGGTGSRGSTRPRPNKTGWVGTSSSLLAHYDVLLLDLDGVVYVGPEAVPGAPELLSSARLAGARLAFVTNNASRSAAAVADHLTRLGVSAHEADVITSAQAAATLLAAQLRPAAKVLVVGGEGLSQAVEAVGLTPVASADDEPEAVVQGFAPTVGWQLLLEACVAVRTGVPWVATNPDLTLPTQRGPAPGNGALVDVVRQTTGVQPVIAGKPFRPLLDEAVRRTRAARPLVIGDRLDTDIAGAAATGLPSLLVLTGISGVPELLMAPPEQRPTFLAADLGGLREPHPACVADGDGWRCRQMVARVDGQQVDLRPSASENVSSRESALDAVRAVCSALWNVPDPPVGSALQALSAWTAPHGFAR